MWINNYIWEWINLHEEQLNDNDILGLVSHAGSDQLEDDNGGTGKVDRMSSGGGGLELRLLRPHSLEVLAWPRCKESMEYQKQIPITHFLKK